MRKSLKYEGLPGYLMGVTEGNARGNTKRPIFGRYRNRYRSLPQRGNGKTRSHQGVGGYVTFVTSK